MPATCALTIANMIARACLVFLVMMNLAVAVWWIAQPTSVPMMPDEPLAGVDRLQLLDEAAVIASASTSITRDDNQRCVRFGPFPADDLLTHARQVLVALADGAGVKQLQISASPADTWRVVMPPLPDAEQARATAHRISTAGFDDYLVIGDGAEAHSIVLGQYSTAEAARKRQAALDDAGFRTQVHPEGGTSRYLAIALSASADVAGLRGEIAALRADPIDCAVLQ